MSDGGLTLGQAARRLNVSPATLRNWVDRYDLPSTRTEAGRHRRFSPGDIEHLRAALTRGLDGAAAVEEVKQTKSVLTYCPHCGERISRVVVRLD